MFAYMFYVRSIGFGYHIIYLVFSFVRLQTMSVLHAHIACIYENICIQDYIIIISISMYIF